MLIGVKTSTLSSWEIKIRHPYEQYVHWGKNINFIFIRDQNLPPPMNNMLIGDDWGNNINFIVIATWSQTRRNVRVAANMFKLEAQEQVKPYWIKSWATFSKRPTPWDNCFHAPVTSYWVLSRCACKLLLVQIWLRCHCLVRMRELDLRQYTK